MKKLICVFLAFVLVLGLTACGKDKEAAENPTEGISESTTENTVKSTEPVEITPAEAPTSEHSDAESEEKIEEVRLYRNSPKKLNQQKMIVPLKKWLMGCVYHSRKLWIVTKSSLMNMLPS